MRGRTTEIAFGIERCGRLDAMHSLIEQLTEDADKIENSINPDTFGRFHYFEDLKGELDEITTLLVYIGLFPVSATTRWAWW